ncbi:MAG: restriction endonuclease subunit S [Pseudomonadota bacterium]
MLRKKVCRERKDAQERRVPEGWNEDSLVKLLEKIIDYRGQSVPKADKGIPLITARNVRMGYIDDSTWEFVAAEDYDNWMTRGIPRAGDVLFTTEAPLGNACMFPDSGKYAVGQRTVTLRTFKTILNAEYLLYFILSERGQRIIDIRSSGSTAKGIKSSELKKVRIPYPPLPEQTKIAQILATWDKAIETVEKLIENSKQQKKALMQQLLMGKKRFKEFGESWNPYAFEDFAGLSKQKHDPKASDAKIECIELEHIEQLTSRLIGSTTTNPTMSTKSVFRKNDILFGKLRPYLRKYWLANKKGVCSTEIWVFQANENFVIPEYLIFLVQMDYFIGHTNISSGTHMPRADWNVVKETIFHLPSIEEQKKIAAALSCSDKEIESLQNTLVQLVCEKKVLMQQLLTGKRRVKVDTTKPIAETA